MEGTSRELLILYGSQTGTAEEIAERIGREGKRRHFLCRICAMDDFDLVNLIHQQIVIFVASTTGQGDPPDNMKKFWRFLLRRDLPASSLQDVHLAVLGLGDSSYVKFNFIAKKLYRRLVQLGAKTVVPSGYADDQHDLGIDGVIDPWLGRLWPEILKLSPLPPGCKIIPADIRPPARFKVETYINENFGIQNGNMNNQLQHADSGSFVWSKSQPFEATMFFNERVTDENHWQDVRLIKFDISGSNINYAPGDVVMVQPENLDSAVDDFIQLLNLDPTKVLRVSKHDKDTPLSSCFQDPLSIRDVVQKYFDIQGVPKRYFFELLSFFTTSEMEKEKLLEFASAEGQEELYSYCYRSKRNYFEVFQDFPNAASNIPLEYLFDLIPGMKPRAFSIASAQSVHPNQIHILMAVVNYKTNLHRPRLGVCSNWLASLKGSDFRNTKIRLWVAKGSINLPKDPQLPIIMVGPGTGVAPFRSIIEDRVARGVKGNILFFGSRNKDKDFFFKEEWDTFCASNSLELFTAFSRDQEHKFYVQHRIKECSQLIWDIIDTRKGYFYIAGNAKDMPAAVMQCLREIIKEYGTLSDEDAELYYKRLDATRHLQCETWS